MSVEENDELIIKNWNKIVNKRDEHFGKYFSKEIFKSRYADFMNIIWIK